MDETQETTVQPTAADEITTTTSEATEPTQETSATEAQGSDAAQTEEHRTFTQEQLNAIVKERLDRQTGKFLQRLGLESMDGIDEMLDHAKSYAEAQELVTKYQLENESLKMELAFRDNGVNPKRVDDIKAYFKGKGLDLTNESLKEEMETHPEWAIQKPRQTTIRALSPDKNGPKERDGWLDAKNLFGLH